MSDGGERGRQEQASRASARRADTWLQWVREAVTIVAAAGAAYMGIRMDLVRNQLDIENLKVAQAKVEAQMEKLRDTTMAIREGARK